MSYSFFRLDQIRWRYLLQSLLCVLVCLGTANAEPPQCNKQGEYVAKSLHTRWKVVDQDPAGLNGRLHTQFPEDYTDIRQVWPEPLVSTWPVVARFKPDTILTAKLGNVGIIRLVDPEGRSWLMVGRPGGKGVCFVRANQRFIRPVP